MVTGTLPITSGGTGSSSESALKQQILGYVYPVGSIYVNATSSTNPGTLLGFGTWAAFGQGRVMVGLNSSDTDFDTAEETGGEKTHLLTGAESGTSAHSHLITDPGHIHPYNAQSVDTSSNGSNQPMVKDGTVDRFPNTNSATTGITINNSTAANASSAHNNLQPYVVVYMWKRTA